MKPLKILTKGEIIDYPTVIEEVFGDWISCLDCYDSNREGKKVIKGVKVEKDRAYFIPEHDYELIIRKKRNKNDN